MENDFKNIAIVGLGAIGASLGMAVKHKLPDLKVWGRDLDEAVLRPALEMAAIDGWLDDEHLAACDALILCTPLQEMKRVLQSLGPKLKAGTIVSDVGSVKAPVMHLFAQYLPEGIYAIGGHPMAGSEKTGLMAADRFLFENAPYILTPENNCPAEIVHGFSKLIDATGARVLAMTASEHDALVARVSHIPHIMANLLVNQLETEAGDLSMSGGGLRDMTRIAASDAGLWTNILLYNQPAVLEALYNARQRMDFFIEVLEEREEKEIFSFLEQASQIRRQMRSSRSCLNEAANVVAIIPDRPGSLGLIGTLLGDNGINIHDLQFMSVRDEDEGTVRISLDPAQAERACLLLKDNGITAWIR